MDDLLYFYPQGHEKHYQPGHPERPERVEAVREALENTGYWDQIPKADPVDLAEGDLVRVHQTELLSELKRASQGGQPLDLDTYTTPESWDLALQAAGGGIAVTRAVWAGEVRRGFALTRPPGHHATRRKAMGFCLLNNIALAADDLVARGDADRVAILDIDLHHGNGTQDIFWERADVFYFSTHQYPHYPGTGRLAERGQGSGKGTTANVPLPAGSGDMAFRTIFEEAFLPLLERFSPDGILVSCGFDPHWRDPLGQLAWSAKGMGELIRDLARWADRHCGGRVVVFLEGGYDLDAARACGVALVSALNGKPIPDPLGPSPEREGPAWKDTLRQFKDVWDL
jgi:acetoin utilization deacetylase AcuC-like enzyme